MKIVAPSQAMQQWSRQVAQQHVLVPTMGALHEGHAALIRRAREIADPSAMVVVSIFVNPIQFGVNEDLSCYPRTLAADVALCEKENVDFLFYPTVEEMYEADASVRISETELSQRLCGASRPGHFSGMATVVAKLFNIIAPNVAIFGEKDWQQLAIIRRFVRDLNFPIEIIGHPTVREEDGLAMSSRNAYLTPEKRAAAPKIYQALQAVAAARAAGEKNIAILLIAARMALEAIPGAMIDYVEIMNEETLAPLSEISENSKPRLFVAVKLGETRLIDNIKL